MSMSVLFKFRTASQINSKSCPALTCLIVYKNLKLLRTQLEKVFNHPQKTLTHALSSIIKGALTNHLKLGCNTTYCFSIHFYSVAILSHIGNKRKKNYFAKVEKNWHVTYRYTRDVSKVRSHCFNLEKYAATKHETQKECV